MRNTVNLHDSKKTERLNLRIVPQSKRLIEQAAALERTTPSDFIMRTVVDRAETVIAEQSHFFLDAEKWENLCKALDEPARDMPALQKLAEEKTVIEK